MALPDLSRLAALPHARLRALGLKLAAIGATQAAAQPALEAARGVSPQLRHPVIVHHLRKTRAPAMLALRALMFDDPIEEAEARAAFGDLFDDLLGAGLLEARGNGSVGSPFVMAILEDLYLFSDQLHRGEDAVMGMSETTVALCRAAFPRSRVRGVLDLGCGAGAFALLCARAAERSVGTDVSPRAVALAQVNAAINGVKNVELRVGDRFEPVKGESFDLIVSQPPFVARPEGSATASAVYGGRTGDELALSILGQVGAHLSARGRAVLLVEWPEHGEESIEQRARRAAGDGLDLLLVRAGEVSVEMNATGYAAGFHAELGPAYEKDALARLAHLEQAGVRALVPSFAILQRASGPGWTASVPVEPLSQISISHDRIDRMLAARALAGKQDALLAANLRVPEGTVLSQVQVGPGAEVPSTLHAKFPADVGIAPIDLTLEMLFVLTTVHEASTVRDGITRFAEQMEMSMDEAISKALPPVEEALLHGVLEIATSS